MFGPQEMSIHPRAANSVFIEMYGERADDPARLVRINQHEGILNITLMTDETSHGKILADLTLHHDGGVQIHKMTREVS